MKRNLKRLQQKKLIIGVGLSLVAHFALAYASNQMLGWSREKAVDEVHWLELINDINEKADSSKIEVLPPARLGKRNGRLSAAAMDSLGRMLRRSGDGSGKERAKARRSPLTGKDDGILRDQTFTHPKFNLAKKKANTKTVTTDPRKLHVESEPTPFMEAQGAKVLKDARESRLLAANSNKGSQNERKKAEERRMEAADQVSSQRTIDLIDAAPAQDNGRDNGATIGGAWARKGSAVGKEKGSLLWLNTPDMRYINYFRKVYAKIQPLWSFPKDLEITMEQGDALVEFIILSDGRIKNLKIRKSSGHKSFDQNVLDAIQKAAPFAPIPSKLGLWLHVMAPFEFVNPMVR